MAILATLRGATAAMRRVGGIAALGFPHSFVVFMSGSMGDDSCTVNISNGLLLYHYQYSFYSQKVLMALYEKRLPFESHVIDLTKNEQYDPWFLQLNPRGEVPVLQDIGKIIPDSARIIDYLEDNFCDGNIPQLIPMDQGADVRQKVISFRQQIDQIPSGIITMGSFYHPELVAKPKMPFVGPVRKLLMDSRKKSVEIMKARVNSDMPSKDALVQKLEFQEKRLGMLNGKEEILKVLEQVDAVLDKVEKELTTHVGDKQDWWLCSSTFTAADISLVILLERLNQLGFEFRFWKNGKRPYVEQYYERVQSRDSYKKTIPNTMFHIKTFLNAQSPVVLGITAASALALLFGGFCLVRKLIK